MRRKTVARTFVALNFTLIIMIKNMDELSDFPMKASERAFSLPILRHILTFSNLFIASNKKV